MTAIRSLIAAAALAGAASLAPAPVLALDDGQETIFGSVMGMFNLSPPPSAEISYRERPPLVLPPKMQLRQPQPGAAERTAAWPDDADIARRRREAATAKLGRLDIFQQKSGVRSSAEELAKGRIRPDQQIQQRNACDLDPTKGNCLYVKWEDLAGQKFVSPDTGDKPVAGVEPPRRTLTDPPKGYRAPSRVVAETQIAPVKPDYSPLSFFLPKKQEE